MSCIINIIYIKLSLIILFILLDSPTGLSNKINNGVIGAKPLCKSYMLKITKQNNLISLDISTKSTGYAIFHSSGSLITSGVLTSKHNDFLVRGNSMADEIKALIEKYEVTQAVIEELKVLKNQKTLTRLAIVQGLIIRELKKCSTDFVSPSVWRSKYSIPRERDKAKNRAIELVDGILPSDVTDDEAEAYLIGKYFVKNIKNGVDR